jgi:hypothetical protein
MIIFIWDYLPAITTSYHDGGGVLVVAKNHERALEILKEKCPDVNFGDNNLPDRTYNTESDEEETIVLFPDAGCC